MACGPRLWLLSHARRIRAALPPARDPPYAPSFGRPPRRPRKVFGAAPPPAPVRLAALFSGGKDGAYAAYSASRAGHELACLVTVAPSSEESMLFHHPAVAVTRLQAECAGIPHVYAEQLPGEPDAAALERAARRAAAEHGAEGLVHGGILSRYQSRAFGAACRSLGLAEVAPSWGAGQAAYMRRLLRDGFRFVITAVAAGGLGARWLGREVDAAALDELGRLSARHGFNLSFEGGEAETLVLSCPLFAGSVEILRSSASWDGCRGRLEIEEAAARPHA